MNTNTTILKRGIYTAVAIALSAFGASAWATSTWSQNLQANCSANAMTQSCGNSSNVVLSGWSTATGTIDSPTAGTTFAAATIYNWGSSSGLGVVAVNEDEDAIGPHATDNFNGIDAMLINFTSAPVNLSGVTLGWNGTDSNSPYKGSDLSVLAWTGSPAGPSMTGTGLLSAGWTLIGNYANVGATNSNVASVSSTVYSSYWLISAYSSAYGSTATSGVTLGEGNDSFKVLSVAGNTCSGVTCPTNQTPEPGSLALLGAGVVGLLAARRRKAIR